MNLLIKISLFILVNTIFLIGIIILVKKYILKLLKQIKQEISKLYVYILYVI